MTKAQAQSAMTEALALLSKKHGVTVEQIGAAVAAGNQKVIDQIATLMAAAVMVVAQHNAA